MTPRVVLAACVPAFVFSVAIAHAEQSQSCEDQLRATRIFAEQIVRSRAQAESELSTSIATLLKRVEALQAQVEGLKAKGPKEESQPKQPTKQER